MHSKVKGYLEKGHSQFPRLCFLTDGDVLRVMSHIGNPVTIMPQVSRMFSAVKTIRFAEVLPSNSPVHHQSQDSKEGIHIHVNHLMSYWKRIDYLLLPLAKCICYTVCGRK